MKQGVSSLEAQVRELIPKARESSWAKLFSAPRILLAQKTAAEWDGDNTTLRCGRLRKTFCPGFSFTVNMSELHEARRTYLYIEAFIRITDRLPPDFSCTI